MYLTDEQYSTENVAWPPGLRRASINSFGFGGSNAHVVIEDAYHHLKRRRLHGNHITTVMPTLESGYHILSSAACANGNSESLQPDNVPAISYQLLVFSASDERGLERNMQSFAAHAQKMQAERNDPGYLQNLAYTLAIRRNHLPWRHALIVNSLSDLGNSTFPVTRRRALRNVTIGFVFTGQGAQFAQMGLGLLKYETFSASLQRCQIALRSLGCTWDLIGKCRIEAIWLITNLSPDELARTSDDSNIQKLEYSQALTTCLQIALVDLLITFGIKPSANIGHSSGEIAAA
jgi:acyl transferase domain-containing protein